MLETLGFENIFIENDKIWAGMTMESFLGKLFLVPFCSRKSIIYCINR